MDTEKRLTSRGEGGTPPLVPPSADAVRFDEEPAQHVPGSFLSALPQFFVFPAILVATLLGVYLVLRGLVGTESDSAQDLLRQVRAAGPHERWQVLHTLADGLRHGTLDLGDVSVVELRDLYESQVGGARTPVERADVLRCLLQILAHKGAPELTPLAMAAVDDADVDVRKGALLSLAIMGDPAALDVLVERLENGDDDERLLALGAVANLEAPAARDVLAGRLRDEDTIVARNAALLLARAGDERAAPFLLGMLVRESYAADARLEGPQRALMDDESRARARAAAVESFLSQACQAAGLLGDMEAVPLLRDLRATDPATKVRSAAINALHDLGAASES